MSFILSALSVKPPGPEIGPAPPPPWLPLIGGATPFIYADFTTEGVTNHYWADGIQQLGFTAWLRAVGGTFSRASTASYTNSTGLIASAVNNASRFDYDPVALVSNGVLLESASTNIKLNSANGNGSSLSLTGLTSTPNAVTAPDGATSATKLTEAATTGVHLTQDVVITAANFTGTASVFVAAGGTGFATVGLADGGANGAFATFDLSNGAKTQQGPNGTGTFTSATSSGPWTAGGRQFWRLQITVVCGASLNLIFSLSGANAGTFTPADPYGSQSYTGNTSNSLYAWGGQVESLTIASSYIPTTSGAVTRAADAFAVSWASSIATLFVKSSIVEGFIASGATIGGASVFEQVLNVTSNGAVSNASTSNGVSGALNLPNFNYNGLINPLKSAVSGSNSSRALTVNAQPPVSDNGTLFTSVPPFTLTIFNQTANFTLGDCAQLGFWTIAATPTQLQALTT